MILSIIQPYYRNPSMLRIAAENWKAMPPEVHHHAEWIIVDDHSPEPAEPVLKEFELPGSVSLYRIDTDIPWNQHGAMNLGAHVAKGRWLQLQDMDRLVLPACQKIVIDKIVWGKLNDRNHYKGRSILPGIPPRSEDKEIVNQFWVTREAYWKIGGYDEDYCGIYGGDSQFFKPLGIKFPLRFMDDVIMFRFDCHAVGDSTTQDLSRDREGYRKIRTRKKLARDLTPKNPLRFEWHEVSLS
jgi:hypothetical protein